MSDVPKIEPGVAFCRALNVGSLVRHGKRNGHVVMLDRDNLTFRLAYDGEDWIIARDDKARTLSMKAFNVSDILSRPS